MKNYDCSRNLLLKQCSPRITMFRCNRIAQKTEHILAKDFEPQACDSSHVFPLQGSLLSKIGPELLLSWQH